ncbi:hypothetical protein M011DRAFT_469364 [Sporormia fimetaria CBS 119925]|uniref:Uncharacterized protein n=1 Tax=Sporormia fimetaria CBS 119925 TaxID=1340428 RepID=A0A6A6V969_9PLEO|nr:hypothetical protein M011DRAFT_469364 [Sporormia fimetaria CBS 119925]
MPSASLSHIRWLFVSTYAIPADDLTSLITVEQEIQSHPAAVMQFMIMQEQKYQAFMIFQLQVGAAIQRYTSLVQQRRYNAQELVQVLRIFIGRLEEYKERVRRVVYDRREEELDLWAEIVGGRVREDSL